MANVKFGTFAKRRNSTKQPTNELSDSRTVHLKESCSQDAPVFIVTGDNFSYNYCQWDGKYYFINDVVSVHNNLSEIHCIMDPLATYKANILASTQFISYSASAAVDIYLTDNRIPVLRNATAAKSTASMGSLFSTNGFYVLTAVGKDSCKSYAVDSFTLEA